NPSSGYGRATATRAPARRSESCSSSSALRKPSVEPSETSSTPVACARRISGHNAVRAFRTQLLESRGPLERHRPYRRGTAHVEEGPIALLDRCDRRILTAPRECPDDRKASRDPRDLWSEERQPTCDQRE